MPPGMSLVEIQKGRTPSCPKNPNWGSTEKGGPETPFRFSRRGKSIQYTAFGKTPIFPAA
eukprot:6844339-Pyramimonas_sp.AAC.1